MSHIPPNLNSGIWTYQNLFNRSNLCNDLDLLELTKQNYHTETLAHIEAGKSKSVESFLRSKYGMLRFKNPEIISGVL